MLKQLIGNQPKPDRERPKWMTPAICALVLTSAGLVIAARRGFGPGYLDQVGKAVYWTGVVFLPLLAVNNDLLYLASAKRWLVLMFAVQILLVYLAFDSLTHWSFLTLTPVGVIQIFLFSMPFDRLSKTK
jgi:hypothetical protein